MAASEAQTVTRAAPPGKPDCPECRGAGLVEAHAGAGVFVQAWCVCVKLGPRTPLRRPPCPRCREMEQEVARLRAELEAARGGRSETP